MEVWRLAKELAVDVYRITDHGEFERDFELKDQVRRAVVSIASHIAEGEESGTNKQGVRFFYIAKGSVAEVQTQIEIACEIGHISRERWIELDQKCEYISKKLRRLIQYRAKQQGRESFKFKGK